MKKIAAIFFAMIICNGAVAQYSKRLKTLGDKAYNNKNYAEAAGYYKDAIGEVKPRIAIPFYARRKKQGIKTFAEMEDIYYRLGESYRLYEDYSSAGEWYYKLIDANKTVNYPLARLWYGICLRAGEHFNEAIKQLEQFEAEYKGDNSYIDIAKQEMLNCRFAKARYKYPSLVTINRLKKSWNTDGGNYALVMHDSTYFFTSTSLAKNDESKLNQIYSVPGKGNASPTVIRFNGDKNAAYATPSVNGAGTRMYLTRWNKVGGKNILAIYLSIRNNNEWGAPLKLNNNVNIDGFDAIQPFVTSDGRKLFFASNKPGGQGGDDIWMSDLDNAGNPVNSTNLGNVINTPFDEQAPYYDEAAGRLIYSSKGFTGLGGFDFFESYNNAGKWLAPQNMGYPTNSAKDDLYYFADDLVPGKFYISSDRESECCLDLFEGWVKEISIRGSVTDCYTQKPLTDVKADLIDPVSNQLIRETMPGGDGIYTFNVTNNQPYKIALTKAGYFTKVINVPDSAYIRLTSDTLFNDAICLQHFELNKPIGITDILYDFDKATLRPASKIALDGLIKILNDNPSIKVELSSYTDSIGSDAYNLSLSQARAQSCVDYIVASGVEKNRVIARGYGNTKPVAPNSLPNGDDNPEGRQLNRRTDFTVLETE